MTVSNLLRPLFLLSLFPLLFGCPPTSEPAPEPVESIWEEDDDDTNGFAGDAEPVDIEWTDTLTIQGEMEDCDYDNDEDWPWTGDEDNYRIEVPEEGYIDILLAWEQTADIDMLIYESPPSGSGPIGPDQSVYGSNDAQELEYLFDEPYDRGDDFVIGVLCATGASGAYTLTVNWES